MNNVEQDLIDQVHGELADIYGIRAHNPYGLSGVNQLMHGVQSGALARQQGLSASLLVAALLHDLGHMVHHLGEHPAAAGVDDRHEVIGAAWLATYFGPAVTEPIRLHVAAKRYLCAVEPGYAGRLSRDSIESLALQGGFMGKAEISLFEAEPYWREAVILRRIDEAAKDPNGPLPPFESFRAEIETALRESRAGSV